MLKVLNQNAKQIWLVNKYWRWSNALIPWHVSLLSRKKFLETDLTEDSFKDNNEKTAFYTELLKFLVFMQVFALSTATNSLTKFQELLLVLMRLRLNMPFQDLAYRYGISRSTACRIFDRWIEVLSTRLNFRIMWPTRENLIKTMPAVFKQHFGIRVAVVIDCFKVFINKPSSLTARSITWSNYKHHNTIKFLIGIKGVISYISRAWEGG